MKARDLLPTDLFADRTVFVTGGSSGINFAIADTFAELGAAVAICGRNQERLDDATQRLQLHGGRAIGHAADVRDLDAMTAAFERTEAELGVCSVVICGAAGNFLAPAEKLSTNGFRAVMDIDLLGTFHTARAAFDQLQRTRGVLLAISAAQAELPFAHQAHVAAAKAGIDMLVRSLALEWGAHGIRCNLIVPGPIDGTEGMRRLTELVDRPTWEAMVPLGRFGTTDDVASLAAFLASPLAEYVTGARITVDGGQGLTGSSLFNRAVTGQA